LLNDRAWLRLIAKLLNSLQWRQRENNQYNKLKNICCCVAEVKKAKPEKTEAEQGEYH